MGEPIEHLYFNWLYAKVDNEHRLAESNKKLLGELHRIEFVWLISGDDNRVEDGLELRKEFCHASFIKADPFWLDEPCSVLEMLVAFSRRAAFEAEYSLSHWFWVMVDNLELIGVKDKEIIHDIVATFVWRTYDSSGQGGLFPLENPTVDQRELEIWYQFNEYVYERLGL